MNQRLIAACIAMPAVLALFFFAVFARLPYATYSPGDTFDVLGRDGNDAELVQVAGHKVYRDDGQLRMTTVRVSPPQPKGHRGLGVFELLGRWFDDDTGVYPYDAVHADDETPQSNEAEGAQQMSTSQDTAVDVAMTELGLTVPEVLAVDELTPDLPAEKVLKVDDRLLTINGTKFVNSNELLDLIQNAPRGKPIRVGIERDSRPMTVSITPVIDHGEQRIGITPAVVDFRFPFEVKINIPATIGGPSAGLIFSLAVYDTLTPGSLTEGHAIAGTGEIYPDGSVGPIGGIQQKIAGARDDGAELFLVPIDNCADALSAGNNEDMRLVMAQTMHDARTSIETWVADPDADLPSCEDADEILAGAAS